MPMCWDASKTQAVNDKELWKAINDCHSKVSEDDGKTWRAEKEGEEMKQGWIYRSSMSPLFALIHWVYYTKGGSYGNRGMEFFKGIHFIFEEKDIPKAKKELKTTDDWLKKLVGLKVWARERMGGY